MKINEYYKKNPGAFFLYVLIGVIGAIAAGLVLFPKIFYDNWIWRYYWGPVVADATSGTAIHNGIVANEGYTMISEITYGILIIISLYAIYKLLKKLEITVDWRFALALMPYIILVL